MYSAERGPIVMCRQRRSTLRKYIVFLTFWKTNALVNMIIPKSRSMLNLAALAVDFTGTDPVDRYVGTYIFDLEHDT